MGTRKMDHDRTRARKRGSVSLAAFALIFALALFQGGSIIAFAGGMVSKDGSAPVASDDGSRDDGSSDDGSSGPAATQTLSSDDGAGGGAGSGATSGDGATDAAPEQQEPDEPGAPSGSGVQPELLIGNQNCAEVLTADEFLFEYRDNSPGDDTVDLAAVSGGEVEGTLTIDVHGNLFDFEIEDGDPVVAVVVKGGSNANLFDYRPGGTFADTDLHAPLNPNNGSFYGLSHISFCFGEEVVTPPVPEIDVEKTCPASVPAGQEIDYTITVENTGEEALVDVTIDDSLLGEITGEFNFDFTGEFPVGAVATATVSYSPGPNENPVENTVTASGTGAESDSDTSDDDSCTTDVIEGPAIAVSKACPAVVDVGETITYEITVSNAGTEDLEGITVSDSVIGDLSASYGDTLAVGASETHEFDHTAGNPGLLVNTVTVSGSGVESQGTVTATDECTTEIVDILGGGPTQPPAVAPTAPGTAFTGSEAGRLGLIAILTFGIGLTVIAATRRWRSEDSA